jgi:CubicO group peptidase (beta-lactamase class C family)
MRFSMKKIILYLILILFFLYPAGQANWSLAGENSKYDKDPLRAIYDGLQEDQSLDNWLVAGPIPVFEGKGNASDQESQKKAFDTEYLSAEEIIASVKTGELSINQKEYKWQPVAAVDGIIDLLKTYKDTAFRIVYAYAEINMSEAKEFLTGVGSDDGIKIWLNNKLVHENWIGRPVQKDDDLVPFPLKKGRNEILVKIQNMEYGWGFTCRTIGQKLFPEKLFNAAGKGDLGAVKLLLSYGADVNGIIKPGLTALHAAKITGRKEIINLLLEKGANPDIPIPPKDKLVDAYFNNLIKENYSGAAILVAKDGKILYENAYGYADIENKIPVTLNTKFRIGSITKQFIASAILKLQEQGLISTADKLSKFIPDFPRGDEVTIHHLLTHTSGIHSFTNKSDFASRVTSPIETADLINEIKNDTYDFNPGEKFLYNNSGYFILGYIIEKVTGRNYGDFLKTNFFDPLGMNNTGVHKSDLNLDNEALGYSYDGNNISKALNWDMSWAGGAGSLYSTIEDLYKWNEAIFNGTVLTEASLKSAFTPVKTKDDSSTPSEYGYGWVNSNVRGLKEISHSGGLDGFNSNLIRVTDQNVTVVALVNCLPTPQGLDASSISNRITEIYLWDKMEPQESYEMNKIISTELYEDYVGKYEYPGGAILTVTREGNKLFAQLTGQSRFEIFPKSENVFFWKVVEAQIKFVRDESGKVVSAMHKQGGQEFAVQKIIEKTEVKVDPKLYDLYTGEYDLNNGLKITVTKEDNHLFAQLTNQPKLEIFPESETEFFLKVVVAQIKFFLNDSKEVTHLIITQGMQKLKADKIK